ncbi:MAG: MCE family protein, partial [Candidatus Kapabacteria bacterium]|nr:MCE family protein [Candidatus Kapabacteria bacterium]
MQKNLRSTEIKVGIITFSAILLAIIGISLGRGMTVAPAGKVMSIRFNNANGIEPSSPVWINGFKRGSVLTVKPDNGSVLVTASLDNYDDIKQDVSARVTILELTGGKKIEIMPGMSTTPWNGNEIKGASVPDFGELLAVVGDMGADAKVLIRRLDTISAHLNVLMADGTFINNVKQMTSDASKTVADIRALVEANKQNLNVAIVNMRTLSEDLKRLVTDNEPAVNSIIKN